MGMATYMRRNQRQIIRLMLENAREGIKKTPLMQASHLNHKQLDLYLKLLIDMELLMQSGSYYWTMNKGLRWLKAYKALRKLEELQST